MTDTDVDVGATTEPGCNIVDVVVHVLVNARLQAKRTDDAGVVVFFAGLENFSPSSNAFSNNDSRMVAVLCPTTVISGICWCKGMVICCGAGRRT